MFGRLGYQSGSSTQLVSRKCDTWAEQTPATATLMTKDTLPEHLIVAAWPAQWCQQFMVTAVITTFGVMRAR